MEQRAPRLSRRHFLMGLAGGAVASGAGTVGYARYVEPTWAELTRRDMPLPGLSARLVGRTLAHISDLHINTTDPAYLSACLKWVASLKPDMVAVTGDWMSCAGFEVCDRVPRVLRDLGTPPLGCFGVPGNHDYGCDWKRPKVADRLTELMEDAGVQMLRNRAIMVEGLQVLGVDDLWAKRANVPAAVRGYDPSRAGLALFHNPDTADLPGWGAFRGWALAGHTHGGQIKLPLLPPPVTTLRNRRYSAGAFDLGEGRSLYVNRGLGYVRRVRFCVRPEVTLFRLTDAV